MIKFMDNVKYIHQINSQVAISQKQQQIYIKYQSQNYSQKYKINKIYIQLVYMDIVKKIITDTVVSYWEYLSYSLRDLIENRKRLGVKFHQIEIWHIIKACIYGYQGFFKLYTSYDFMPSKLMINQEGRIRLNWIHLQEKNQHANFIKKLYRNNLNLENEEYFSPEQLQAFQHKQLTSKINFEKCNIFSLGMTLLECLTLLNPIVNFYTNLKVNYQSIQGIMSSPSCKIYSQNLLMLIGSMLRFQPIYRPTFQGIVLGYSQFMNRDFSIMIHSPTISGQTTGNSNKGNRIKPKSVEMRKDLRLNF